MNKNLEIYKYNKYNLQLNVYNDLKKYVLKIERWKL
jgi:hypothetical protein